MKVSLVLGESEFLSAKNTIRKRWGPDVRFQVAMSDLEAIQRMYLDGVPDLFLVDLDHPGVIGFDTFKAMRRQAEFRELPIIVLSAKDRVPEAREAGVTLYLSKPLDEMALADQIQDILNLGVMWAPLPDEPEETDIQDARKAARKSLTAACVVSTGGDKIKGRLCDISLTGARVIIGERLPLSGYVDLIMGVPGTVPLQIIQFKAKVVRATRDGYGLAFRAMDTVSRDFVRSYTAR